MTTATAHGLSPLRKALANGVVALAQESSATPAVTINAALEAGSVFDPPATPGLAYFTSRLIDRGTEQRSADDIAEALDSRGVTLNVGSTRHAITVSATCLTEDFEGVLDVVADVIMRPIFPEDQIARRRAETITLLRQDQDNPAVRAVETVFALAYGSDHPYGRPPKGTITVIESIDRRTMVEFCRARFVPSALTVAVVGAVEARLAIDAVGRAFGTWDARSARLQPDLPPVVPPAERRRRVIPMMGKSQADIAYGFITITRTDPEYPAWWMMNTILGQFGLGGRLGDNIRERQGMAYYVYSAFDPHVVLGPLLVRAGVDGSNVDRAIAAIDAEVARLAAKGATDEELAETRQFLIGSLPRMLETNPAIATFLQTVERFGLGLDYDRRLPGILAAVTRDDVNRAAAALSPDRASIAIAGPYQGP